MQDERRLLLDEELLLVRHSGEIPEVALHASLYYLEKDSDGPKIAVTTQELQLLNKAAQERYEEMIMRDLTIANRDLSLFRGLRRAEENWRRYAQFCRKVGFDYSLFRQEAGLALIDYLQVELDEVAVKKRKPSINCAKKIVCALAKGLALRPEAFPPGWETLCSAS